MSAIRQRRPESVLPSEPRAQTGTPAAALPSTAPTRNVEQPGCFDLRTQIAELPQHHETRVRRCPDVELLRNGRRIRVTDQFTGLLQNPCDFVVGQRVVRRCQTVGLAATAELWFDRRLLLGCRRSGRSISDRRSEQIVVMGGICCWSTPVKTGHCELNGHCEDGNAGRSADCGRVQRTGAGNQKSSGRELNCGARPRRSSSFRRRASARRR